MVGRLLETGQLQHAVAHLAEAEARDAEHLAFVRHDVGEQLHVARVDVHVAHDEADLVDDGLARGFDAEHVARLHDAVGARVQRVDALGVHAGAQAVALDEEGIVAVVVSFDDGARGIGVAADGQRRENMHNGVEAIKCLNIFSRFSLGTFPFFDRLDIDADEATPIPDIRRGELELLMCNNGIDYVFCGKVKLKLIDGIMIEADLKIAAVGGPNLIDVVDNLDWE